MDLLEKVQNIQKPKVKIPDGKKDEVEKSLNGLSRQVKLFGKTVPISKLQEIYEYIYLNKSHLIDSISWSINTIRNKKEVKEKDSDKQYYRNFVKWNKLREFLRTNF